ncbi:OmpA family protein [Robiginitalea sp. M366]|uniref:OmpA family protein n=1 Tax=Robiginitalea aestuariiviva TaxID=3036903 RepID=UPI00240D16FD|nr:OmpA family protein [Robiginitalea aestuariiviva]MDG1572714.1 OmpA family protein [Robiginitalea aestuariiviva]
MKARASLPFFIILISLQWLYGQEPSLALQPSDSLVQSYWLAGLGWNAVDDSWKARADFPTTDMVHLQPYPSRVSLGRYFRSGLGLEVIGSANRYREGKVVDGAVLAESSSYWAVDTRLSYDLNRLVGPTGFLDPYVGVGAGVTNANSTSRSTLNGVVGTRIWFSDRWGLDLNSTGKWALKQGATNHLQHAAGVVYRFRMEEGLTRKGEAKKALLEAQAAEAARERDSLAAARQAEEEALQRVAEELARKEEAARQALAEAARKEAEQWQELQARLAALGTIRFAFNSSYLSPEGKEAVAALAAFMQSHPNINFEITGHTDARGTDPYNLWLSERRASRVAEALVARGIAASRISIVARGESELRNHCADGVSCTAPEHAENRRVEVRMRD